MTQATLTAQPTPLSDAVRTMTPGPRDQDAAELRERARATYREAVAAGRHPTGDELGTMFDRSPRWGRDRIAEVRSEASRTLDRLAEHEAQDVVPQDDPAPGPGVDAPPAAARQPLSGGAIAWAAFTSGVAASVAANVLHAQQQSTSPAAWVGAAFWPLALMLAIEVLTRVHWPTGSRWYTLARYGGTGLVALVAAVISYRHMTGLLTSWGEDPINAHLGPLAVDGLMVIAAAALLATGRARLWRDRV